MLKRHFDALGSHTPKASSFRGLFGYKKGSDVQEWSMAANEAIAQAAQFVELLRETQPQPLSRTVAVLDALSDTLCAVLDATELILNVHPLKHVALDAQHANAVLTNYMNSLNTNVHLYNALNTSIRVQLSMPQPCPSQSTKVVADLLMKDFQKSGIHLNGSQRSQFVSLSDEILSLGNAFVRTSSETSCESVEIESPNTNLIGVDPRLVAYLTNNYRSNVAVIPMENSSICNHILQSARSEHVRRLVYLGMNSGNAEALSSLETMLKKRKELSNLLGKSCYSELWLADKMVRTPENVNSFLTSISKHNKPRAELEMARLKLAKSHFMKTSPQATNINAWDEQFYTRFLTPFKTASDSNPSAPESLRPYFSVGTTIQGISNLLSKLYGISLEPAEVYIGETWHQDVRKVNVVHESEGVIGIVYMDLFKREDDVEVEKFDGAAHFTVRCSRRIPNHHDIPAPLLTSPESQTKFPHPHQLPIIVLVTSFDRPTLTTPTLLSLADLETLFHEMGHVMHSVLARTEYQHISGTRCALDFVEIPSNLLEAFGRDVGILASIGEHFENGSKLSEDVIRGFKGRQGVLENLERQKQVMMAILDQAYHSEEIDSMNFDTTRILKEIQTKNHVLPHVPNTVWQTQFSHLYSYGASYYSYLWARRVSDLLHARLFTSNDADVLRRGGEVVKNELLLWGGGRDPWVGLEKAGIDISQL